MLLLQLKNQTIQHGQSISAEFKCMFSIVRRVSHQGCLKDEPALVIVSASEGTDCMASCALQQRICFFRAFARNGPAQLRQHLNAVVENIILLLEPSDPVLRRSCLKHVTKTLIKLCAEFPMLCFDQLTQRLVLGGGRDIVIYDLRTATKWRVLQGHAQAVSAVAVLSTTSEFAIASYSAGECAVFAWTFNSSFFGTFLGTQGSIATKFTLPSLGLPTDASVVANCALTWISPKAVRLRREDGSTIGSIQLVK